MLISQMPPPCKSVTEDVFSSLYSGVILAAVFCLLYDGRRKICGLRLFHAAPWPTRSQKPGEAGCTGCGGISEGIGIYERLRLEAVSLVSSPAAFRCRHANYCCGGAQRSPDFTSSPSARRPPVVRRLDCSGAVAQYLQWRCVLSGRDVASDVLQKTPRACGVDVVGENAEVLSVM